MMEQVWDFLRDEQNREALRLLGAVGAALALAAWALFKEVRTARRLDALRQEVDDLKASQADILRSLETTERRHDLLFGVLVGAAATRGVPDDESPA
jgi:hypothetical protein